MLSHANPIKNENSMTDQAAKPTGLSLRIPPLTIAAKLNEALILFKNILFSDKDGTNA